MNFKDAAPDLDIIRASMEVIASDARTGKSSKLEGELAQIVMDLIDVKSEPDVQSSAPGKPPRFKLKDKARIQCAPFNEPILMYLGFTGTVIAVGEGVYAVMMSDGATLLASDSMLAKPQ